MQVSGSSRPILGIAMGVVGAVVGMFAGNPMLGFKLGMMAGSFLFIPKAESQVNRTAPSDIQILTCETGNPIPVFYGAFGPVSGNVVYFGNKTRITHTQEQEVGGKGGGPKSTSIWYTWEVDFVISLGWGPGTVLRAYGGGKEIKLDKFRILDGSQTTSDAVFSAKARQPVYKGLILVVAEAYDLGTSGQFPLLQFEVARKFPVEALGTHHWTTTVPIPAAGGIDSLGDEVFLGGGSTTALPLIDIYDAWLKKDDTVPGTIPAAVKRIAVADNFVFLVEWTASPLKVYKYNRADMACVATLDLTGTANKIFAISCDEYRLFICYNNTSNAVRIGEYKTSDMSLENTRTITGITAGQEITDLDVDPLYFYATDTAAATVWQIPRSTLAATSRTIAAGVPNGLDIDNNGNVWVANSGTSVYQYSPAWELLNTITNAAFGSASGVAIMPNQHKLAVLAKTGDAGTVVCVSTGELTTAVQVDFEYERTWKIAAATTSITKLAASGALLAALEAPSSDIFLYGPTGYHRNTIAGTFIDVDVNELGAYAIPGSTDDVSFYAGGEGAANTRNVSDDVAADSAFNDLYGGEYTFGATRLVAVGKDAPAGNNMMYVVWNNIIYERYIQYFVSYYTLAVNGNVSTATYEGTFPIFDIVAGAAKSLRASAMGYGLLLLRPGGAVYGWSNQSYKWQRVITSVDRLNGIDWTSDSDRFIGCAEGFGAIDPTVWIYSKDGIPQKTHTDTTRLTKPTACAYFDGRIYVADEVAGAGNTRILSYICEASPLSSVGGALPAEVGYELLTNTKYGAGFDPSLIDKNASGRANSFCFEHRISIMPMYTGQMTAADLLEDLCAHHNGFISVAGGKIAHRQFVYDPFDDDCAFVEEADKSDDFADGILGDQWDILGPIGPNLVANGGFEDGVTDWNEYQGTLSSVANGLFGRCLQIMSSMSASAQQLVSPITIGKRYRICARHKSGSSGSDNAVLRFADPTYPWTHTEYIAAITTTEWRQLTLFFTAQYESYYALIYKDSNILGTMLFDEVSLQEIPNIVEAGGVLTIALSDLANTYIGIQQTEKLYGAFDIQVDFSSLSITAPASTARAGLAFWIDDDNYILVCRQVAGAESWYISLVIIDGVPNQGPSAPVSADTSGKFRIVRKGQSIYCYRYVSGAWSLINAFSGFSAKGGYSKIFEWANSTAATISCAFDNYKHYESPDAIYPEHIVTEIKDAKGGSSVKDDPVAISNTGNRDRINQVLIEYSRRSLTTGPAGPAKASDFVDIAENGLNSVTIRLPGFRRLAPATFMAYMYLKKALAMTESIAVELGWKNKNLKAGDLAWITYPLAALDHAPIRIASLEVTPQGTHKVTAMREDDIYDVDVYADDIMIVPTEPPPNADPGDASNIRLILMPAELSAPLDYDLDVFFTAPPNDAWAGASIYQAYAEDGDYVRKGTTSGAGVLGVVVGTGDSSGTKYIDVRLDGPDTLSSLIALPSYFQNLAYVLDVSASIVYYIQFTTVTLRSLTTWRLTGLTYDAIKAPVSNSYGVIAAGDAMVFYGRRPFTLDIPDADLGVPLWFKVLSVNLSGQEQSLAEVTAQTITVAPRNTIPSIGEYAEGTPAALTGDAVHHSSDGLYYRANPFTRPNVVGIKDGFGRIITTGPARQLPALTPGSEYYLKCPAVTEEDRYTDCANNITYTADGTYNSMYAQGFSVSASGKVIVGAKVKLCRHTDNNNANVCLEIRANSGGVPANAALARSEWIPYNDIINPEVPGWVYFRFFEYVELAANTQYHLVIRLDMPVWVGGSAIKIQGTYTSFIPYCQSIFDNGSQTWSNNAAHDIPLALFMADVDDAAAPNIATTHPFDTAGYAPVVGYLPVQKVGLATSPTDMIVDIDKSWPQVVHHNWSDTYSGIAKHHVATLDLLTADKLLVLYRLWSDAAGYNTVAKVYLNDIAGTQTPENDAESPFEWPPCAQVFNRTDLELSARKYLYIELGAAGTPKAGRITVLSVQRAAGGGSAQAQVIPDKSLVPVGGTTGQVLAKATATDYDGVWTTITPGVPAGSVVVLANRQNQNVGGGTTTKDIWNTMPLNTEINDSGGHCSLSSNRFTLTAGTYLVNAFTPLWQNNASQIRLRNITAGSTLLTGVSGYVGAAVNAAITSALYGVFTVAASQQLEIQVYVIDTKADTGFGTPANIGEETYGQVMLIKLS